MPTRTLAFALGIRTLALALRHSGTLALARDATACAMSHVYVSGVSCVSTCPACLHVLRVFMSDVST